MTKQDIINAVAEQTGLSEHSSRKAVDATIDIIVSSLKKEDPIYLRGLGTMKVVKRKPKMVRDITRGENYMMGATKRVTFIPGKELQNIK